MNGEEEIPEFGLDKTKIKSSPGLKTLMRSNTDGTLRLKSGSKTLSVFGGNTNTMGLGPPKDFKELLGSLNANRVRY